MCLYQLLAPLIEAYCAVICSSFAIFMNHEHRISSESLLIRFLQSLSISWSTHWRCLTRENHSLDLIMNVVKLLETEGFLKRVAIPGAKESQYQINNTDKSAWLSLIHKFGDYVSTNITKLDTKTIDLHNSSHTLVMAPFLS